MNTLKHILSGLILIIVIGACGDYLDTVPKGKIIPESVLDLELLLRDEKTMSKGFQNPLYMTDEVHIPDEVYTSKVNRPIASKGYKWAKPLYAENEKDQDWRWLYSQIWTCNYILERIDEAPLEGLNESDRNIVKGQALAARATAYFNLVNVYGKHFDPATASSDLAVPIITSTSFDQSPARSSVEEVYQQIDNDLTVAFDLVEMEFNEISFKHSKASIYGLKARIALLMENWAEAQDYANLVLDIKDDLWDYNDYKNVSPTTILRAHHATNNIESVFSRSNYWFYTHPAIFTTYISSELYDLFSDDDLRIQFFATHDPAYDRYIFNLFWYAEMGITVPEMYLIVAETEARLGKSEQAMVALNTILANRIDNLTFIPETAANADEALTKVLVERRKEFMFTGLRWLDQRRLIKIGDYTTTVNRTINGETFLFEATPENYIVNIPIDIENL